MRKFLSNVFMRLSVLFYDLSYKVIGAKPLHITLPSLRPNRLLRVWHGKTGFRRRAKAIVTMRANLQKAR